MPKGLRIQPDDLLQEALLRVVIALPSYRGGDDVALVVWLRRVVRSSVIDQIRRQEARIAPGKEVSLDDLVPLDSVLPDGRAVSPLEWSCAREAGLHVQDALAQVPDPYRRVIELRIIDGSPFGEVARVMGLPTPGAARALLGRALSCLAVAYLARSSDPASEF